MPEYGSLPIEDFDKIIPLCRDFFELANEPGKFNAEFFINYWQEIYKSERGVVLVEAQDGEVSAMLGCIACVEMTTGDTVLEECFMYADAKKKTNAFKLLNMMEEVARNIGAKVIYIKHTAHLDGERLERIYNRKGFVKKFIRYEKVM